jgi:hypothetical protein
MSVAEAESVISRANDQAVRPWQDEPYRLWSLLDMLRFHADAFCRAMGILPQVWPRLNAGVSPDEESVGAFGGAVQELDKCCLELQLPVSHVQANAIMQRVRLASQGRTVPFTELGRMTTELYSRVIDELASRYFLMLKTENVSAYAEPLGGWDIPIRAFHSIQDEITEAQKCYALERSTACVFHLMRALEVPLKVLSTELGIVKHSPTWEAYLSVMEKAIATKFPEKTKAHGEKRAYFTALEGQLRAIKTAWRNPTMHEIAKLYTSEMANELLVLVRGFMREAAKELQEPP